MLREIKRRNRSLDRRGQNAVEYLLVFALVVVVIVLALAPNGFMTRAIDQSFDLAIDGMVNIVNSAWP